MCGNGKKLNLSAKEKGASMRLSIEVDELIILKGPGTSRLLEAVAEGIDHLDDRGADLDFTVRNPHGEKPIKISVEYLGGITSIGPMVFEFVVNHGGRKVKVTYWYDRDDKSMIAHLGREAGTVGFIEDLAP